MEHGEEYAVVPDSQAGPPPPSGGFAPPRPALPFHPQMHMGDAYLSQFAPKPFAFESAVPGYPAGTAHGPPPLPPFDKRLVPQLQSQPVLGPGHRLTASQQSELEMARKRAEKAAEGKRANQTAVRRAKRRASRAEASAHEGPASSDDQQHNQQRDEIEAKLATVEDEKEAKRLKRLLRNRVSAQQARERKKSYVSTLENKSTAQEEAVASLEQRVKVLERENVMLRSVIKNMQGDAEDAGPSQPAQLNGVQR